MDRRFELVSGCFSRDTETNRLTAQEWGVSSDRTYGDIFEMLDGEKGRIDLIAILTPVHAHAPVIAACVEMGFDVISEKPLSGSVDDCQVISDALTRYPRFLAVTMNYTGYPMVRELRERIRRGDLGSVHSVRMTMQQESFVRRGPDGTTPRPQAWRLIDGEIPTVSLDLGTHVVHMYKFLFGSFPQRVMSRMDSFGSFPEVIDDVDVLMESDTGPFFHGWWGKSALGYPNGLSVEVFGSAGSAKWVQMDPEHLMVRTPDGIEHKIHRGSRDCIVASLPRYNRFKAGHPDGFIEAFANCYSDIADAWQGKNSTGDFVCDVHEGTKSISVLDAATRSARSRTWLDISIP